MLLERVGSETRDPAYAAHWLAEAANVWSTTLGDAHRAARVLMMAIEKDPTAQVAAERLAQLYRDKGDTKALVALLDRRAKALTPLAAQNPELRGELAGMHEELGRLWSDAPLSQPKKAIENYKKAIELDPTSAYAIYNARELYKQTQEWQNAIPLYGAELELEQDPARRVGLMRDEAATRKLAGDLPGATRALASAREIDGSDPALQQEYASSVLDRIQAGEAVPAEERNYAAELLVALAETYEGEHGLAYAGAALDIEPGNDRGIQLYAHYARSLGQENDLTTRYNAYLSSNPSGAMATEVRGALGASPAPGRLESTGDGGPPRAGQRRIEPEHDGRSRDPGRRKARRDGAETRERRGRRHEPHGVSGSSAPAKRPSLVPPGKQESRISNAPPTLDKPEAQEESPYKRGPAMSPEKMQGVLDAAQMLAGKGKKPEAFAKYKEVLDSDPAHAEALAWTEDYLRSKRDTVSSATCSSRYPRAANVPDRRRAARRASARSPASARATSATSTAQSPRGVSCSRSIAATRARARRSCASSRSRSAGTISRTSSSRKRPSERHRQNILLEKKLAKLQEDKRKDLVAAGEAWARISRLLARTSRPSTPRRALREGRAFRPRGQVLAEAPRPRGRSRVVSSSSVSASFASSSATAAAGDSYAEAAEALRNGKVWEEADRPTTPRRPGRRRPTRRPAGLLSGDLKQQAVFFAQAADTW